MIYTKIFHIADLDTNNITMKFIESLKSKIQKKILDQKIKLLESQMEFRPFEIFNEDLKYSKADWKNFYKNINIEFDDLINHDADKSTGLLKTPEPPNKCLK